MVPAELSACFDIRIPPAVDLQVNHLMQFEDGTKY